MKLLHRLAMAAVFLSPLTGHGAVILYNNFSDTTGLKINADAAKATTSDGAVLRILPTGTFAASVSASVFTTSAVNAATFSAFFRFRITNPGGDIFEGNTEPGADGFVFTVQNVSSSTKGFGDNSLGYRGMAKSVGVEFDSWYNSYLNDPDDNHVGIDIGTTVHPLDGLGKPMYVQHLPTRLEDGNIWYAWVDYDGTNLEVRTNETGIRPTDAIVSRPLDLPSILGGNNAFVGFTAGRGGAWENIDILSMQYNDSYSPISSVPEPGTLAVLGVGGVLLMRCKRRSV